MICPNCGSEDMVAGKVTQTKVMQYTEWHCPNGCNVWSEPTPLPGHEPVCIEAETEEKEVVDLMPDTVAGDEEQKVGSDDD